jgi:Flp pilus assembly protein TadD
MGRSVATGAGPESASAGSTFDAGGYRYEVERRDGRFVHREQRLDENGRPVAEVSAPVSHAIGSGRRGLSFLVEREGFVTQSPIAWYSQAQRYDLAPGYRPKNLHFERTTLLECLNCHSDGARPAGGAFNHYATPFDPKPIGCERCHGPGALHVVGPGLGREGFDPTIVNPSLLSPALRESVCQQCHLQGDQRVVRRGRGAADFRPGLPLDEFVSVFFESAKLSHAKAVGQVEQMQTSRCYKASGGALGCTSCHDPHHLPPPERRIDTYRASCLACHESHGCSLPEPDRRARQHDDSCIDCHMPRRDAADIAHVAMSDHRILREPGTERPDSTHGAVDAPLAGRDRLTRFGPARADGASALEDGRDLGIALFRAARPVWRPNTPMEAGRRAVALLDAALAVHPDDVPAMEAKAHFLWMQGNTAEARATFQSALRVAPDHERNLEMSAVLAQTLGRRDEALSLLRRAVALNPYCADYHRRLARLHAETGDWPAAGRSARAALRLDISQLEARAILIESLRRSGDRASAEAELRRLLDFDPPNAEALRRVFNGAR